MLDSLWCRRSFLPASTRYLGAGERPFARSRANPPCCRDRERWMRRAQAGSLQNIIISSVVTFIFITICIIIKTND